MAPTLGTLFPNIDEKLANTSVHHLKAFAKDKKIILTFETNCFSDIELAYIKRLFISTGGFKHVEFEFLRMKEKIDEEIIVENVVEDTVKEALTVEVNPVAIKSETVKEDEVLEENKPLTNIQRKELEMQQALAQRQALVQKAIQKKANVKALSGKGIEENEDIIFSGRFNRKYMPDVITPMSEVFIDAGEVLIEGEIFSAEVRELTNSTLFTFEMTDKTSSVTVKFFARDKQANVARERLKKGLYVTVFGRDTYDNYMNSNVFMANYVEIGEKEEKGDYCEEKRVELHAHTQMSSMDGVCPATDLVKRAQGWGHKAIAITDHGGVQSFPDALHAKKGDFKVIYGVEAYIINDEQTKAVYNNKDNTLNDEFVVFDIETTGLNPKMANITEIGAVKIRGGEIVDSWNTFVDPECRIPANITALTGITDEMVAGAPKIAEALEGFCSFSNGAVLVAHNASFDIGFMKTKAGILHKVFDFAYIDTLWLSRKLLTELKSHKLNTVAKHLKIDLTNHHRAVDDAMATAKIFINLMDRMIGDDIKKLEEIDPKYSSRNIIKKANSYHAIILAKTQQGIKDLYRIISAAHLDYFYRRPKILKSMISEYRDGFLLGSACEAGELYDSILGGKSDEFINQIADFYDYYEIQPTSNNMFMVENGTLTSKEDIENINRQIIELGKTKNKLTVATCDVHFLDPDDAVYRSILLDAQGFSDSESSNLSFRTTDEMLEEFSYLGEDLCREVVITNTNKVADMIDDGITPINPNMCTPVIDGAEEDIENMTYTRARAIYGDELPKPVQERITKELNSIINNGFAVLYLIAQKLVKKSLDDGYLVGSRGSVGSSFVAYLTGITEVNSLSAHYVCPQCKNSDFVNDGSGISGCDLPPKACPICGSQYIKDGHDIPFETFLGFDGDKAPDIDLNFSGDYQAVAHKYTEELFGEGHTFKAGTIGTLADKTAYGFVKKYLEKKELNPSNAEINRLISGCTGIKRTTGQHPGGIIVLPHGHEIFEFCPVQHPADDSNSDITTTHFDYHSIDSNLLKLDILGHDDPTVIRMLEDITGIDAKTIDIGEEKTMGLFQSTEALGVTSEDIKSTVGTFGVPEFGTRFVRQMLVETKPTTFSELVRISGLSHGTDVWTNNAQDLVREGTTNLKGAICTRDDIMIYLMHKGVEPKHAFNIMESVRKGKGLKENDEQAMLAANVPAWYIKSCKTIKYMFPKAHAVAYVTMAFRIAWFKLYHPEAFYTAYFTVRADDFDYEMMALGRQNVLKSMDEIDSIKNPSAKEKNVYTILEMCNEMYVRGIKFLPIDLYKSHATKFARTDDGIRPPLNSIAGLGVNAAISIMDERENGVFYSKQELITRTKVNKTNLEILDRNGCLSGMTETSQMTLF